MNLSSLRHQVWAITRDGMRSLSARYEATGTLIERGLSSLSTDERARLCYNGGNPIVPEVANGVATVEIMGDIVARAPWWAKAYLDAVDPFDVADTFDALAIDPAVTSMVIEIDSGGGTVAGTYEANAAMRRFQAAGKTVEVRAAGILASAAYALVAPADRIVATSTTTVGSLGTMVVLTDDSAMLATAGIRLEVIATGPLKGQGADGTITPAMRDQYQRHVDALNQVFKDAVSAGRGIANVDALFTGDFWVGAEALKLGLIDAVASPADEIDRAEGSTPPPQPVVPPLTGDGGTCSNLTPPAAAGLAQESIMDAKFLAALTALSVAHPTHAEAFANEAAKPGASIASLEAFAAPIAAKAKEDAHAKEVADLKAKADAAEARATKADADLAAARAHSTPHGDLGGDNGQAATSVTLAKLKTMTPAEKQAHFAAGGQVTE